MNMNRLYEIQRAKAQCAEYAREDMKNYFKAWETPVNKFNDWSSDEYYNNCRRVYQLSQQKKDDRESLECRRQRLRDLLQQENCQHQAELAEIKKLEKLPRRLRNSMSPTSSSPASGGPSSSTSRFNEFHSPSTTTTATTARSTTNVSLSRQPMSNYSPSPSAAVDSRLSQLSLNPNIYHDKGEESPLSPLDRVDSTRSIWQAQQREKAKRDQKALEESRKIENEIDSVKNNELKKFESNRVEKQKDLESLKRDIDEDHEALQIVDLKIRNLERESRELAYEKETFLNAKRAWAEGNSELDDSLNRGSWERQSRLMLKKKCFDRMRLVENDRKAIQYIEAFLYSERNSKEFEKSHTRKEKIEERVKELKNYLDLHQRLEEAREKDSTSLFEEEAKKVLRAQEALWSKEKGQRSLLLQELYTDFEQQYAEIEFRNAKERELLFLTKNRLIIALESKEKNVVFIEEEYLEDLRDDRMKSMKKVSEIRLKKEGEFLKTLHTN